MGTLSMPHTCVDAARICAPVFQAEQWMYVTEDAPGTSHIPLEGEIAEVIHRRVIEALDRGESAGGRLLVRVDRDSTDIYLKVGSY